MLVADINPLVSENALITKRLAVIVPGLWRNLLLGSVLAPACIIFLLSPYARWEQHLEWGIVVFTVFVARILTMTYIRRNKEVRPQYSFNYLLLFVALIFPLWGSCYYVYFDLEPVKEVVFSITFVVVTLSSGALISFVIASGVFYVYLAATLIPVIIALYFHDLIIFDRLAIGIAIYAAIISYLARHYGELLAKRLQYQLENESCVDQSRNEALIACNARRDKELFFTSASHDLRQPLQTLTMLIGITEKRYGTSSRVLLGNIKKALADLTMLFDALFDSELGKLGIKKQVIGIDDLISPLLNEYKKTAEDKGIKLNARLSSCDLLTDPGLMRSVIRNILDNAVKYTFQGGVLITCRVHEEEALIQVWDTGIGICKSDQERIFNTFSRVGQKKDGTTGEGLGLANARKIAGALGYSLTLKSTKNRGSVFTLKVPVSEILQPQDAIVGEPAAPLKRALYGIRLLLIEDEQSVLEATRLSLMELGAGVYAAETAKQAMELATMQSVDLILTDYRLKGSVSGLDVVNMINQGKNTPLPYVVLSGEDKHYVRQSVAGCQGRWLTKPASDQEISEAILSALGRI